MKSNIMVWMIKGIESSDIVYNNYNLPTKYDSQSISIVESSLITHKLLT